MTKVKEKVAAVTYKDIFDSNTINTDIQMRLSSEMRINKENFYIDIKKIIEENDIKIVFKDLKDDESGRFIKEENKIIVNENHSENRQRFTLAHEFAHYLLGHESSYRSANFETYGDYKLLSNERDANNLAADLLMPKVMIVALLEKFLEENNLTENKNLNNKEKEKLYEYISSELKVSKAAIGFRLLNLGLI